MIYNNIIDEKIQKMGNKKIFSFWGMRLIYEVIGREKIKFPKSSRCIRIV